MLPDPIPAQAAPVRHPENFPVASWLCPPALRPDVAALYHYARTADDLADEGEAPPARRHADLAAYRRALHEAQAGRVDPCRWPEVFGPLRATLARHRLDLDELEALLDAFVEDVDHRPYANREALLDYCRRSAQPVGRLLLQLQGADRPAARAESDAICTALQLINFWQDLGRDLPRGRVYLPRDDLAAEGLQPETLDPVRDDLALRRVVGGLAGWSRRWMLRGQGLVHRLPGRFGWELRLVVQGGLRVLDRLAAVDHASWRRRPALGLADLPGLGWRALRMKPSAGVEESGASGPTPAP